MHSVLMVMINPLEGREAEFNRWYTHVHIRDVMRFPASIRVQRLAAAEPQIESPRYKYFTVYDTMDAELLSLAHKQAMGTPRMVVSEVFDKADLINSYYYPVLTRTNAPGDPRMDEGPLLLEQLTPAPERAEAFERWYEEARLPGLLARPGVVSGSFMKHLDQGQMFVHEPAYTHVGLYRAGDLGQALDAFRAAPGFEGLAARAVSAYAAMAPYLTRDMVADASPEEARLESEARAEAAREMATTEALNLKWR